MSPTSATSSKTFLVGGAVRDTLLGLHVHDRDHVVVGSSVDEMLAQGFRPVGKDFPVFLHPETHEEHALARTERKSGVGYKGFVVHADSSVTLEEDLGRRDLTINAMAMDADGAVIDPHGGRSDLAQGILRHVSAVAFVEDPVRVLRLARFAARYAGFRVADDTLDLVRQMVDAGELQHLVAERVWQELSKGLMESRPERMIEVLRTTGALKVLLPELDALWGIPQPIKHHPELDTGVHVLMVLQQAVRQNAPLEVRFAALLHDLGKGLTPEDLLPAHHGHEEDGVPLVEAVCERLKVPKPCRDLAVMVCREHLRVHRSEELRHSSIVALCERTDAFRRPDRFEQMLLACECDARGRLGLEDRAYPQRPYLTEAWRLIRAVDAGAVAAQCADPSHIRERIHGARTRALNTLNKRDFFGATVAMKTDSNVVNDLNGGNDEDPQMGGTSIQARPRP